MVSVRLGRLGLDLRRVGGTEGERGDGRQTGAARSRASRYGAALIGSRSRMASLAEQAECVEATVRRLSVLLRSGVAPSNAWGYLLSASTHPKDEPRQGQSNHEQTSSNSIADIAQLISAGCTVPEAIVRFADSRSATARSSWRSSRHRGADHKVWRAVAAAWTVAETAGSPLAPTLDELATTLRRLGSLQRSIDSAVAGPLATAKLIAWLPLVALIVGPLLGFNTLGILFGTTAGFVLLAVSAVLGGSGVLWTRALVRTARPPFALPGLNAQLIAIGLGGGGSIPAARFLARSAIAAVGLAHNTVASPMRSRPVTRRSGATRHPAPARDSALTNDQDGGIAEVLRLSALAGVPAAALLIAEADRSRRDYRSAAERRAAALETTLLLPLGLCALPTVMLLGVAPLMLAVFTVTLDGL